jgi:hypothetical protein
VTRKGKGRADRLQIQTYVNIKAPPGATINKAKVLQQILDRAANDQPLPPSVDFGGIFWRNPDRKGKLSYWRYHEGAKLDRIAPKDAFGRRFLNGVPLEDTPRGSLHDATDSLGGAILSGIISF